MLRNMHISGSSIVHAALVIGLVMAGPALAAPSPLVTWDADTDTGDLDSDGNTEWEDGTGISDIDWETGADVPRNPVSSARKISHAYEWNNEDSDLTPLEDSGGDRSFQALPGDPTDEDAAVEIWFKPSDLVNADRPGSTTQADGEVIWETGGGLGSSITMSGDQLQLAVSDRNSEATVRTATLTQSDIGDFVQVIGSIDLTNNTVELFLNGVSVSKDTSFNHTRGDWSGGNNATLGSSSGAGLNFGGPTGGSDSSLDFSNYGVYDGQIAQFNLYNQPINEAEAGELYTQMIPEPGALTLLAPAGLLALRRRTRRRPECADG